MAGKSHLPYQHKSTLETSLEGIDSQPVEQCSSTSLDISNKESGICKKCFPVLSHYKKLLQAFTRRDVFSTTELAEIASQYSAVVIDKGDVV